MGRDLLGLTQASPVATSTQRCPMSSNLLGRLPWPDGWSSPKRLKWIVASLYLGLMGGVLFVVGIAQMINGGIPKGAVPVYGSLLCFLGAAQGVLTRAVVRRKAVGTIHRRTLPESGESALFIPYSRRLFWLIFSLPVLLLLGVGPVAAWSIYEAVAAQDVGSVVMAAVCLVCLAYLMVSISEFLRNKITCGYVALSSAGIYHRSWALTSFVPWEHVTEIWPFEGGGPVITVQATANAEGWSRRTSRFWKQPEAGFGLNLTVRGMYLSVDPALVYHALRFYFDNPRARSELSGDAAVRRLKRADIPVPSRHL